MDGLAAVDRGRAERLLRELVAIPSVNPAFPDGTGEAGMTAYMIRFFERLGLPYLLQQAEPSRCNVVGMLDGAADGGRLLLEAHMDTVQTTGMTVEPFGGVVANGRLYGRGACDTKGSLAAMMLAIEQVRLTGGLLQGSVHLAAVVDEEYRYTGVSALADAIREGRLAYDAAIAGEPTGLHRVIAHKGVIRFRVDVHGVAGHTSDPASAVNAVEMAAGVIAFLKGTDALSPASRAHPLAGPPTLCISMIEGGSAPNTIPDHCRLTVDRRTVPGERPLEVWRDIQEALLRHAAATPGLRLTVHEPFVVDYAMETEETAGIVRVLGEETDRFAAGRRAAGAPYATDASKLALAGVPSVVFGPGNLAQAHTADEWVELDEVAAAANILAETIVRFGREPLRTV